MQTAGIHGPLGGSFSTLMKGYPRGLRQESKFLTDTRRVINAVDAGQRAGTPEHIHRLKGRPRLPLKGGYMQASVRLWNEPQQG